MKVLALLALTVAAPLLPGERVESEAWYACNQDVFNLVLRIKGDAYTLEVEALDGERCVETGKIERDGEKMRFMVSPEARCAFAQIIRDSWLVTVARDNAEFLVRLSDVSALDRWLKGGFPLLVVAPWFQRFRPENEKESNQLPEPTAASGRGSS